MVLLPVYAVAVCVLVARFRRRPLGYILAIIGALIPMGVLAILRRVVPPSEDVSTVSLGLIMWAESWFMLAMGLIVASLPRPHPKGMFCTGCKYDLTGLHPVDLDCPECGMRWKGKGSGRDIDDVPRIPIPRGPIKRRPHL